LNKLGTRAAGIVLFSVMTVPVTTRAASISTYWFLLDGPDSLTFVYDSIAGSTFSNRILRYRISDNAMSKMASDVAPNTNLTALNTSVWFTTRYAPFRIGRADLSTVTGAPAYYGPADVAAPYDDMTLGADNSLWATNAQGARVVRVTQSGVTTSFAGNGTIHPLGIARGNDGNMWFADGANRRISRNRCDHRRVHRLSGSRSCPRRRFRSAWPASQAPIRSGSRRRMGSAASIPEPAL
jgi:hypothetical protein